MTIRLPIDNKRAWVGFMKKRDKNDFTFRFRRHFRLSSVSHFILAGKTKEAELILTTVTITGCQWTVVLK